MGLKMWLQGWAECGALPGCMLGIYDAEGQELFCESASSKELRDAKRAYKHDTLFRIYSMTKPITSVAILMLVERGVLSLDDALHKWIPAFATTQVAIGGTIDEPMLTSMTTPITIRHLLTHTSGLSSGVFGDTLSDQIIRRLSGDEWKSWFCNMDLSRFCELLASAPLCFQPGSQYHYSLSTDVLGRVIEVASGQKLDVFFQQEIFNPLNMTETFFTVPPQHAHRLADCYEVAPGKTYRLSTNPECNRLQPRNLLAGGGGLVSTISDFAKFATLLVNKGTLHGVRLLTEATIDSMTSNHLPKGADIFDIGYDHAFNHSIGRGMGFGLGVSVITDPSKVCGGSLSNVGEYAWGGVAASYFFIDPVRKTSSIFFTQVIPAASGYPIRAQMRWMTYWFLGSDDKDKMCNSDDVHVIGGTA